MRLRVLFAAPIVLGSAMVAAPSAARPPAANDPATQCVHETERAQVVRDEGRFVEARDLFRTCAREQCPRVVRKDCADFAADLDARIPTLIVVARDEHGRDVGGVRVVMDDKPIAQENVARALAVDPGSHVFRLEAEGRKTTEVTVVVREGERNRSVEVVLTSNEPTPSPQKPVIAPAPSPVPAPAPHRSTKVPTMTWILGGVAVASGATFGVLSLSAVDRAKELERSCAPRCSDEQIEPVETRFLVGRIAGGVAIGAAAVALLIYAFGRPTEF